MSATAGSGTRAGDRCPFVPVGRTGTTALSGDGPELPVTTRTSTTSHALAALSGTWTLDPAHTRIGFVARHAMVTRVRGSFDAFSGTVVLDGVHPAASTAVVAIEAASIDTRNAQRDAHLRSEDFLAVGEHPFITFASTGARQVSATEFRLVGDLTIKGVARSVTIPFTYDGCARDPYGNLRVGFQGGTTIRRKDFGITWNTPLETGGVLLGDTVLLELDVSAVKGP